MHGGSGRGEGAAVGFPAGRRSRPVVSGELRWRRSERGRPSPNEAGKASRPLRGKRVPLQAARTRNNRHPPALARRYWAVSGLRLIGSASGREGESRALLGPLGLTLTRTGRFMGWHVMRLSCGFHAAGSRVAAGLLGLTRNYSDLLEPSKMACRNDCRGALPALLSDYGARWANRRPCLLGTTRTYSYPLGPAGPGISPGLRGRLISLNGSGGRSSTGTGPWGRSRAMRGCLCRRGSSGST